MGKIDYIREFRAGAHQLNGLTIGRQWCEANVPLEDAIAWANAGYLPDEAAQHITEGISPQMVVAISGIEEDAIIDEPDELTPEEAREQLLKAMEGTGFVDPSRVIEHEDPDDPTHIHLTILPEDPERTPIDKGSRIGFHCKGCLRFREQRWPDGLCDACR